VVQGEREGGGGKAVMSWFDRSVANERFTRTAGIFQPPPVQTEMARNFLRDFIAVFGSDHLRAYNDVAYDMHRFTKKFIRDNRRRLSDEEKWDIIDEMESYVESGQYRERPESPLKGKWFYDEIMERIGMSARRLDYLPDGPMTEEDLVHSLGGLDISGWRYEDRIMEIAESADGAGRLEDLVSNELKMIICMNPGEGWFNDTMPGTEIAVPIVQAGFKPDSMFQTASHEMGHYGQACMNYMIYGKFESYGPAGSPSTSIMERGIYDYGEIREKIRGNMTGYEMGEMNREYSTMHRNTPGEFFPNLIYDMEGFISRLDNLVESGNHRMVKERIKEVSELSGGNYGIIAQDFNLDVIHDKRVRARIINEILNGIQGWLETENGRKYLKDTDKMPPPVERYRPPPVGTF
jgi:hypothetical protein